MTYQRLSADEVLTTTRSVRRRLDLERPVDLALVRESLEIALQAPSGSNAQHWHFMVITDAEKRAAVGEVYQRACHQYLEGPGAAGKLHADDAERSKVQKRVHSSVAYLADVMGQVPVQVIACARTGSTTLPTGNQSSLWGSVLPAAWSYMLAARERGLGTAWTTLHLLYEREVADILGIPDDVHQGVLIPTAHYTGTTFKPAPRQPLDEVLHINQW